MPVETTHVIKKGEAAAARAVRPDPTVLSNALKIPAEHVDVTDEAENAERSPSPSRLVLRENAHVVGDSVEVATRLMDEVRRPDPRAVETSEEAEDDAGPSIERIEEQWAERLDTAVAEARDEAFEAGRASIRAEMEEAVDAMATAFVRDLNAVQKAWENHLKEARIQLVQLAFRVAGVVLDAPLPSDVRRISETAIRDAADAMVDGVPLEIVVHPVSYLRLQEAGIDEQLGAVHSKLRWRSDPTLKENEWIVHSSRSAVRRLEAELLDDLQRELSLRDVDLSDSDPSSASS